MEQNLIKAEASQDSQTKKKRNKMKTWRMKRYSEKGYVLEGGRWVGITQARESNL